MSTKKRANNLIFRIADPDNIRLAAWKAAKGKRNSAEVLAWLSEIDLHVPNLQDQILSGKVNVGQYRYFTIYEPKERRICAATFGEQVLHHSMMNICHEYFEKRQIFDSYASRKGKGTYAAIERAKIYTKRFGWYLKLDVQKFFDSICHEVLVSQLGNMFKDAAVVSIFEQIIQSYTASPGRGLPIGNLTSQYFANHYLSDLDHFIKEKLRVPGYVRYMDDMALWRSEKAELKEDFKRVQDFIETRLRCALKPESLQPSRNGLPFLGYRVFPYYVRLLAKSKLRYIKKLRSIDRYYRQNEWPEGKCQRRYLPLLAFINHAETFHFRKSIILPEHSIEKIGQTP